MSSRLIAILPLLIAALAMLGCAKPEAPRPPPVAAMPLSRPTRCPFGHATLRDIPVLSACTFWQPELRQTMVCVTCGYAHDPARYSWERASIDPDTFESPLNDVTRHFPIIAVETRAQYFQSIEGTRSVHEGIRYLSTESVATLEPQFAAYFNDPNVQIARTPSSDPNAQMTVLAARTRAGSAHLELLKPADGVKTQISFELAPR